MNKIIRDITYPVRIFPLVGYALDHGGITCVQANTVMGYVPHSPKAAHYFDFGCQVGVLYEEDSSQLGEIVYLPTQFGRTLYLCWQEDHRKALAQLMGSIPQYRFHTELLLAELILSETVRSASFAGDLARLVATPGLHWYFAGRMRWIQDSIGWRDASSFRVDQLSILSKRILALMRTGRRYYEKVWAKWDNALGFGTRPWRSRLTRMERLCEFLQATRQQPLRVVGESLDDETLVALVLLMVAKEQCYALTATHCADAIGKLLGLGVDVRQDDGTAYLFSAVDLIIRDAQMLAQSPLGDPGLAGVNSLLNNFLGSWQTTSYPKTVSIKLGELFQYLRAEVLDHGLFVSASLADEDDVSTISSVQFWKPARLPCNGDYDFLDELILLANTRGKSVLPAVDVLLNDSLLSLEGGWDDHVAGNPHLALLLLLLYDVGGASEHLRLLEETWYYKDVELISALDQILRLFGYEVWNEGYRHRPERRQWLGRELVNLACRLGICQVDGARLIERKDGPAFHGYYYKAVNALSKIKALELTRE